MRIIAGVAGGRRLVVPPGEGTRPTSDRAREAMFSTITSLLDLDGAHVLDLYAGSGALGLEAGSRGAGAVELVESAAPAVASIRDNVAALGLDGVTVHAIRVQTYLDRMRPDAPAVDLLLVDAPYDVPAGTVAGQLTRLSGRLAPGALVVVERSSRDPEWVWPAPLEALRVRRYGAGALWYGRRP